MLKTQNEKGWGFASVVECLLIKCKAPSSVFSSEKQQTNENNRDRGIKRINFWYFNFNFNVSHSNDGINGTICRKYFPTVYHNGYLRVTSPGADEKVIWCSGYAEWAPIMCTRSWTNETWVHIWKEERLSLACLWLAWQGYSFCQCTI